MADAGFTHAAGADIPHSATSRRGMLPALAGLAVGLAYAAISVYWAVGGRWLLNTVGISLSQPGQAGHLAALLAVWGAAAVKAVAAVLPLLAIGVWPRTANGGLRRLARVLTWIEAAILVGYGLVLTASGLLVQAGVIKAAAHADRLALKWHAYLWDPWFLIWGIFVFLALWRSRPASQDHLPGAPGAAAARSYGYPGAAAGRGGGGGCPWPGGGGHRPGGGQCDAGEHVLPAADRHHAMAGSLTGRAQRGQRAGDNDGELRALAGRSPPPPSLPPGRPGWRSGSPRASSPRRRCCCGRFGCTSSIQILGTPGEASWRAPSGDWPRWRGWPRPRGWRCCVSDVAILIADALRAFLTAKVVFLKEHGSVAWSGSARSELADLCMLSALTPDAERREYSALGSLRSGIPVALRDRRWGVAAARDLPYLHSSVVAQHDREGRADQGIGRDCQRGCRAGRG